MISKISVTRFKVVDQITFTTTGIDVLIGGNNSGKSSILQALQFAVSIVQTANIEKPLNFNSSEEQARSLSPEQIIYSPIKDVYSLIHGSEPLREGIGRSIVVEITELNHDEIESKARVEILKGRNKNILARMSGSLLQKMADIDHAYSMYVPGLAGIPYSEEYRSLGAIRRAVAKGDSNTILRNVLFHLSEDENKWRNFNRDLKAIFKSISVNVHANLDTDGIIEAYVSSDSYEKPIDAMGTGILQAIQISAYMNYFEPSLLLLDEPDAHLHPNNQKMLAQMILQLSGNDKNIVLATHSRHLVSALRKNAQIVFMKKGKIVESDYSDYDLLMDIGALDEYDVFRDPNVKFVIATEDTKPESNRMLSLLLQSSGFSEESFIILPYEGAYNVNSVVYLARCLKHFRQDLSIVIHRDSDGMYTEEIAEYKEQVETECNVRCFITDSNDLEMYYCNPKHIHALLVPDEESELAYGDIEAIYKECMADVNEKSKERFLNRKLDKLRKNRGSESIKATEYYDKNVEKCINGHDMMGAIVSRLHARFHLQKAHIIRQSEYLHVKQLADIMASFVS